MLVPAGVEKMPVSIDSCRLSIRREMRVTDMLEVILRIVLCYHISHPPASKFAQAASGDILANRQEIVELAKTCRHVLTEPN